MGHEKFDAMGIIFEELTYSHTKSFDKKICQMWETIPRYGKLVPTYFTVYGNIFSLFMENR